MDKIIEKSELRKMARKRYIKIGAAVLGVAAVITVCMYSLEKSVDVRDINLVTADAGELETTIPASGRVVPAYEEIVNAPVTTRVIEIYAQPGDSVKAGTPLLALDLEEERTNYEKMVDRHRISEQEHRQMQLTSKTQLSELAMQIEVKEMQVSRLKIDVDNERKLDSLGSGTGERVRQAETAYAAGVLELRQMRQRLANERLRDQAAEQVQALNVSSIRKDLDLMQRTLHQGQVPAPHDGILTYIVSNIGTQVSAGTKVAVVSNLSEFKIMGEIPEGSSDRIGIGSKVTVRIGKTELYGTVTNITPQAKGGLMEFVVNLDQPRHNRLRSGLRTELYVNYGYKENVVRIPNGKYFKGSGEYDLFVLDGTDRLKKRHVKLGDSNRTYVEVVSGLKPGDRVAIGDMDPYRTRNSLKIKN